VGAGVYEARQAAQLREQNSALQKQQASLAEQIQQLKRERDETANRLASMLAENEQMKSGRDTRELLKLRGEAGRMRDELRGLPAVRVTLLKQKLEERPDKKIPELALLTEKDWEDVAWNADLDTDDGVRVALRDARSKAVETFLNLTRPALKEFLAVNNDILPSNLLPLKPYYGPQVTDDMLQRYAFIQTGKLSTNLSEDVIREAAPVVDDDYEAVRRMSMTGGGGNVWNKVRDAIADATWSFVRDNNGQLPGDSSQLTSYLKRPIDAAIVRKYFGQITNDMAVNHLPSAEITTLAPALKAYAAANNGQMPQNPSDLSPYLSTPEQQAAFHKVYWDASPVK
jgi:hypothetical protein